MKTLNPAVTQALINEIAHMVWLLKIETSTPRLYTTNDIYLSVTTGGGGDPITDESGTFITDESSVEEITDESIAVGGTTEIYSPQPFEVTSFDQSSGLGVDSLEIELVSINQDFAQALLSEDVGGVVCTLSLAPLNQAGQVLVVDTIFRGMIDSWELTDSSCTLTIVTELALWGKKTMRIAQATCPWTFKGLECAYSGSESWCNQTYMRCGVLGNQENYGGFRHINDIMEKELWWGVLPLK